MKIEKLTENKIRVIVNPEDLNKTHTDIQSLMTTSFETQGLFFEILEKAEREVGFYTEGCKLLIEAFSSPDDILVFTITKSEKKDSKSLSYPNKKKLSVKRKSPSFSNTEAIYRFDTFEQFCEFCNFISRFGNFNSNKFSKDISLYLYNDTYYLVAKNINIEYEFLKLFYSSISEFGKVCPTSKTFSHKLVEHGKVIMKKNAIQTGIKFFIL